MSKIQAVIFKKNKWSTKKARQWLTKHKLKPIKRVHITEKFYRYRIKIPNKNKRYITKRNKKYGFSIIIQLN